MKKINLIEWLWKTDSHEKQKPQRFARYAAILIMLLTLGVGQMWADYYYRGDKNSWGATAMTVHNSGLYEYYSTSAQSFNGDKFKISKTTSGWDYNYSYVAKSFNGGSANIGDYSSDNCYIWDSNNGYIVVYYPNTLINTTNKPKITFRTSLYAAPTLYIKHSWDGSSWTWGTMSRTGEGIYTYTGNCYTSNGANVYTSKSDNNYLSPSGTSGVNNGVPAVWSYNAKSNSLSVTPAYTLTVNNDGHGSASGSVSKGIKMSTKYAISASSPSTGYHFYNWTRVSGGTCTFDNASSASTNVTVTGDASATVRANFALNTYTVVYNANDDEYPGTATGSTDNSSHTYSTAKKLTSNGFSRTGYSFAGWATTPTGSVAYSDGQSVTNLSSTHGATVTLYAKWTENMSDVSLVASPTGKGTFQVNSSAVTSTTAGVTTTKSVTAVPISGYRFTGWSISGDASISSTSTNPTTVTGGGAGSTATLTATFEEDLTYYDVTFGVGTSYTSLGSLSAKVTSTSAAITSGDDLLSGTGITFTASPNTGYTVEGWYTDATCTLGKHDAGSTTYSIVSLSDDVTVYVKFVEKTWSVAFAAGTGGTVTTPNSTPRTVGQLTGISIAATPGTGYTFNSWSSSSGGSFVSGTSTNSNTFKPTANTTVTASFNETMSTLSTSCHYDAGNPSYAAPAVTGSYTNVGYATTRTITATAAGTGYTFAGWTLTNCTRTDNNGATSRTITIRSNGDGAAATVVANYNEVLTQSTWIIKGGSAFGGTAWTTEHALAKQSGHSTESVVYKTFTISSTNTGDSNDNFKFKVVKKGSPDAYFGLTADGSYYLNRSESGTEKTLATENADIQLRADVAGDYIFKVDYSTPASPKLTITFPTSYTLTYSIGSVAGNNGSISTSPSTSSGSKVLSGSSITLTGPAAKTGYTWKGWYTNSAGTEGKITDTNRAITVTMNADKTLYACYTENTFNVSASATPAGYGTVTPTSATSMGQVTGGNITATPTNTGYQFDGWSIASGTGYFGASGTATTSNTANTKFRPTAAATLTGTFSEIMRTVTVAVNNSYLGSVSTTSLTNVGPVTKSAEVTATPVAGATFSSWGVESGLTIAGGYTSSSNPVKVNATAASKTLTANFTETLHSVTLTTADASKGTVGSSPSVGQITAVQITATPKSGYMFSKWVKTAGSGTVTYYTGAGNGQVEDASGEEKETTYICVTGAVTLQATWEPDRSSGYVVFYGNDGKNADGGSDPSQARAWKDGKLYRPTTAASDVSYFTFTAGVGDVGKVIEFKVHKLSPSTWYGYSSASGGKIDGSINNATLKTSYGNGRLCIIMPGSYTFTWDKSNDQLSISYPTDVYYVRGGFNSWGWSHPMTETSSGVYSATVNMTEANHTYSGDNGFKVLIAGQYYGKNSTTVTRSTSTGSAAISSCSTSGANIGITTDYTGDYTFTYTVSTNTLQVTYPTAYKVTYGKGTINGSTGNCSAIDIDNGDAAVTSNSTWVKSGNRVVLTAPAAKSGYRYLGWYDNNSATGDAITTNANCTITVSSALTRYACYAENLSSITVSAGTGGTVTTGSGTHSLGVTTTQAINASASNGYSWSTWTTTGNAALGTTATTASNTAKGNGTNGGSGTVVATFTPNEYDIILDVNGGSGDNQTVTATFAAAMPTVQKGGSTPIAARTKTGYNFDGYTKNNDGTGTKYYTAALASNANLDIYVNNTHIYAKWNAKQSAITFDYQTGVTGYSSSGDITNATGLKGTYDADMTALIGTMPSADEGYAFTGFYDATSGGTKYYNADGTSAHAWDKDTESGTTLYARWEKAEITALTLDAGTVEPGNTVGVTPTISPAPAGTTSICWEVQYAATGNPLSPQPGMTWDDTKLTFAAPAASGLYKIVATLKTGDDCDGGTTLSSSFVNVQVAGTHTVTIAYKYSSTEIAASTSTTGRPLEWTEVVAHDIFGYSFSSWTAGDGITIRDTTAARLTELQEVDPTIVAVQRMKATYDGTLTANYIPKKLIYFKNTLGWENVYVNFYKSDYWNSTNGSGNNGVPVQNKTMTRLGETDIWYYDYGSDNFTGYTNTKPTNYVSFTNESRSSVENFWGSGTGILVSYPARRADDLADKANETGFYEATPMFVPLEGQTAVTKNESGGGKALYYNSGYWTKYLPGTGYTLEIYNAAGDSKLKEFDFTSADELMPMKAVADLEANTTYKFQIKRHGDVYLGNSGTMTYSEHGLSTPWEMTITDFAMCGLTTTAYGDYTFHFTYSAYHNPSTEKDEYRLRLSVDYPVADGDYRLVYTDDTRSYMDGIVKKYRIKPSAIVNKVNDGTDIVSFFVRHDETPVLRIQQASVDGSGNITWNEYPTSGTPTNQITGDIASAIDATGVYNFNLSMNGSGAMTVTSAEDYTGNFYIRTDAANSKWDNYRTDPDHLMTYSEYSITHGGYSHYYTHWVNKDDVGRKNVKFVIANDYSPCISDTLARETASGTWANIATFMEEGGDLKRSANVRFMWNSATNEVSRAYIDGSQEDGSQFLLLLSDDSRIKQGGATKTQVTFNDNGNWLYEANVSALPNAQIKLRSTWGEGTTIVQYFKGTSDDTETLVGGSGEDEYNFRLIYDFKTNRLLASYVPASGTINTNVEINADVMFVREHQGDIAQLTFSGSGAISEIQTAYGVLRFNKWTINNKDKSTHDPLSPELSLSRFERDLFYISFPFRVNLEEVFGFGTYGTHWIIQEYDGAARARDGYWADSKSFWKFIFNRKDVFLEPNKGYLLALDLDELGESSSVWANTDQVELYFPSYGTMPDITKSTVTHEVPAHTCNIGPRFAGGDDRRVKDSHWNVMSVPTYINTSDVSFANTDWITAGDGQLGPNFLYTVNWSDNSLTATSGKDYTYKAMHAYIVQYCGNVTWTTSVSPATAPNRNPDALQDTEYRLELRQNDQMVDQAFVRLSDDEQVTTGFDFNYDLSKEFNKNKANIYTMVTTLMEDGPSITETAGNCLPMSEQTTVVPVGVIAKTTGDYTFAIPEGTNGVGVTLIDNETGIRTPLSALDYTVNLTAGTYNERFVLEISPIHHMPTDIEMINDANGENGVRKLMIDGILYIVKDGKMFDARGARVQ